MLRATVLLAAALALAGCADLGDGSAASAPAVTPASGTDAADTAPDAATPPIATATPAAPAAAGPAAVPPPVFAPVAPALVPALAPPGPAGAGACAVVTANGPAREIDLDRVRLLLRGGDYRRGSFETNASYRTRIRAKLDSIEALATEQTGRADLVFSLPIPAYRLTYDADRHELWIGSELGLLRGGSAIGMGDFVLVSSSERQIGRHVGTIAYGSRATPPITQEVAKITGDQLGIVLPGGSSMGWPSNFERLHVPMTATEAAAAKSALAVLFVGRLAEPYFITGEFLQEPKRDEPVEKRLTVETLKLAVDCAAVYDRRSGRVIRQILPAGR